jgi:hypothetical protein
MILIVRGVQAVITGSYWLKPLTANRLEVIFILPTATANRLGGGGYFYNRRLAVITGGLKTAFEFRFWAGLKSVLGYFYTSFGPGLHLFWAIFCTDFNFFKKKI